MPVIEMEITLYNNKNENAVPVKTIYNSVV